jgi:hypothetical protein
MSMKTTNAQHSASILLGDDPKKKVDDDHFGLEQMVNAVSRNLDQHVAAAGYITHADRTSKRTNKVRTEGVSK